MSATYGGTTGHSGTDTSQKRAEQEVPDGSAEERARLILSYINSRWYRGATVKELRDRFPKWHHGKVSSTLTNLHRAGRLARLTQSRDRCKVYVTPSWVSGRPTEEPRRNRLSSTGRAAIWKQGYEAGQDDAHNCVSDRENPYE